MCTIMPLKQYIALANKYIIKRLYTTSFVKNLSLQEEEERQKDKQVIYFEIQKFTSFLCGP